MPSDYNVRWMEADVSLTRESNEGRQAVTPAYVCVCVCVGWGGVFTEVEG